ncbi:NADP-dependent oxidoreductase domain-containing protein [Ilyonectria sp. MPI-CAGE-AT-0026]|nr:NADP-dependent oxidoreductase domain-containing protein [Ilyonectria sp. MPI-CAGE-AT-0026]
MPSFDKTSLLFRHRQLAPLASVHVSPPCPGSMNFGESGKERDGECSKETAFGILDHFYSQEGNCIDTANRYHDGESEEWLGERMASRDNRDKVVLATKFSTLYMGKSKDTKIFSNYRGNGSKSMKLSLEASLKELQTSYVDIPRIHWWDYATSIPELMNSLRELVLCGKVLYLAANQYARDYDFDNLDMERDINPHYRNEGMTAEGFKEREKDNPGRSFIPLSLAYALQYTSYVFPIIGGRTVEDLKGNTILRVVKIRSAYEFDPGFTHTFLTGSLFTKENPRAVKVGPTFGLRKDLAPFIECKDKRQFDHHKVSRSLDNLTPRII